MLHSRTQNAGLDPTVKPVTDRFGVVVEAGDIILHGEMYWQVIGSRNKLWVVRDRDIEELQQYWCDCAIVVGSQGFLYASA